MSFAISRQNLGVGWASDTGPCDEKLSSPGRGGEPGRGEIFQILRTQIDGVHRMRKLGVECN